MLQTQTSDLFSTEKRSFLRSLSRSWCEQVWAEHKYLVMLASYRHYKEIAQAFHTQLAREKELGNRCWSVFTEELLARLVHVKTLPIEAGSAKNALSHAFGHLRERLSTAEREEWTALLERDWQEAYRRLFVLTMSYGDPYLQRSRLFSPDAPIANVWVRCNREEWFIRQHEDSWEVLSPEEVKARVANHKVDSLVEFRLAARLGQLVSPLDSYDSMVYENKSLS